MCDRTPLIGGASSEVGCIVASRMSRIKWAHLLLVTVMGEDLTLLSDALAKFPACLPWVYNILPLQSDGRW